jgi:hypothetical protein
VKSHLENSLTGKLNHISKGFNRQVDEKLPEIYP